MFLSFLASLTLLALWLVRKRLKFSSKKASYKIKGPFAAVKIKPCGESCGEAQLQSEKMFLINEAPGLPLKNCDRIFNCRCRFVHFDDRRQQGDRRSHSTVLQSVFRGEESRNTKRRGRRWDD